MQFEALARRLPTAARLLEEGFEAPARFPDLMGGTARRAVSLRITERRESAIALARTLTRAVDEVAAAIAHLRASDEVLARCRAIKGAEEEADRLWEAAVTALFAGSLA